MHTIPKEAILLFCQRTELRESNCKMDDLSGKSGTTQNFMRQFRDKNTRQLKNLTSAQFMEVWSHYDKDGKKINLSSDLITPTPTKPANNVA